jgi:hypothetical protein
VVSQPHNFCRGHFAVQLHTPEGICADRIDVERFGTRPARQMEDSSGQQAKSSANTEFASAIGASSGRDVQVICN